MDSIQPASHPFSHEEGDSPTRRVVHLEAEDRPESKRLAWMRWYEKGKLRLGIGGQQCDF